MGRVGVQLFAVGLDDDFEGIAFGLEPDSTLVLCQSLELAFVEIGVHVDPLKRKKPALRLAVFPGFT